MLTLSWRHFNPRSREGSDDLAYLGIIVFFTRFQSTLPRRERPSARCCAVNIELFQSTLPRRERQRACTSYPSARPFQSTLPRRERHTMPSAVLSFSGFQSTLPRRERQRRCSHDALRFYFNPRSREGSDAVGRQGAIHHAISIHAPAKGATIRPTTIAIIPLLFQSTLPRRERRRGLPHELINWLFQSTLPRRERQDEVKFQNRTVYHFNPRSREGSDKAGLTQQQIADISIHAPAKGATNSSLFHTGQFGISIHAPAKGAT